jgi:archaellin
LGPYEEVEYLDFSSNGASFGIVFQKDNSKYIQINKDKIYGPYELIEGGVTFSKDGSNYGWIFTKNEKCYVQIKEKTYGPYGDRSVGSCPSNIFFSENGSEYGWIFYKKEDEGWGPLFVQLNDQTYGPYEEINYGRYNPSEGPTDERFDPIQFSKDGSKYGWAYYKENDWYVVLNDKIYGPYDYASGIIFSNDSLKYGWEFKKDNKYYIQINDKTYGPYDKATFTFTKDNKAYIAYISGNELVVEEVE